MEPALMLYSLTGPGIGMEAYLKAAVKDTLDPYCIAALGWGLWGGIQGSLKWKGNDDIPITGKTGPGNRQIDSKHLFSCGLYHKYLLFIVGPQKQTLLWVNQGKRP